MKAKDGKPNVTSRMPKNGMKFERDKQKRPGPTGKKIFTPTKPKRSPRKK